MQPTRGLSAPSLGIRSQLIRVLVLGVLVFAGAVLLVTTLSANKAVRDLSHLAVDASVTRTDAELERFFGPVEASLLMARDWGRRDGFDLDDFDALNRRFVPLIDNHPQITSMMIANSDGEEWMLLRQGDEWVNRLSRPAQLGDQTRWLRSDAQLDMLSDEQRTLDYDPRVRPWFEAAAHGAGRRPEWTSPYTFFTTKDPGITASIRWQAPIEDGRTWVIAFDLMLIDVSGFTTGLQVSPGGKVVVLTEDERVMGLPPDPRYGSREAFKPYVLKPVAALGVPELERGIAAWRDHGERDETFRYADGREQWWASFHRFELGEARAFEIGVMVPERDFRAMANSQRNWIIGLTLAGLAIAVLVAFLLDRAVERILAREVEKVRQLGQYTLEDKLGEGGMGAVYRARHAMLRRPTAIKLLHPSRAGHEHEQARFEQEVQLTAELSHPNTIAVYDYGRTPEGIFYYAMEYIDGITLDTMVGTHGPLPPSRVIHVLLQVCGSLQEAHNVGLVHRDIKPENIMLAARGGVFDTVKVLDFGLVTALDADDNSSNPQGVIGTPRYMAPETIQAPTRVDHRADLYAVGLIGIYLLTGKHLFDGPNVQMICAQQLHTEAAQLWVDIERYPDDLARLLLACTHKSVGSRPLGAGDLAARLRACADAGRWTPDDAATWWETHTNAERTLSPTVTEDTIALTVNLDR